MATKETAAILDRVERAARAQLVPPPDAPFVSMFDPSNVPRLLADIEGELASAEAMLRGAERSRKNAAAYLSVLAAIVGPPKK